MTAHPKNLTLLTCMILTSVAGIARSQHFEPANLPPSDFDYRMVTEPIGVYEESRMPTLSEGFFFTAERMHNWFIRPRSTPIGLNGSVEAFVPAGVQFLYVGFSEEGGDGGDQAVDTGESSVIGVLSDGGTTSFQFNSIDKANSYDISGFGNRLEFGWVTDGTGWLLEAIDGIKAHREDRYGFDDYRRDPADEEEEIAGTLAGLFEDQEDADTEGTTDDTEDDEESILPIDGLTTIHMLFSDPLMLLNGFVDLDDDGLPDERNGLEGLQAPYVDDEGVLDPGDTVRMAVIFDDMLVRNVTELRSIGLMGIQRKRVLKRGIVAEAYFGGKFLELDDQFGVEARGGLLTDSSWQNRARNRMMGPQVGFSFTKSANKWSVRLGGRFVAAANVLSIRQNGILASHLPTAGLGGLAPSLEDENETTDEIATVGSGLLSETCTVVIDHATGTVTEICDREYGPTSFDVTNGAAPGVPLRLGGHEFFHQLDDIDFSPVGEIRLDYMYKLLHGVAINAGCNASVMGNVTRASNTVVYELPQLGIRHDTETLFSVGFSLGILVNR